MRLVAFKRDGGDAALGLRMGHELVDLTALGLPATLRDLLQQGPGGLAWAREAAPRAKARLDVAGLAYLPPVEPAKAIAVGLNYVDHAAESPYKDAPKYPVLFHRFPQSWVAHGVPLVRPRVSEQFDYEGEMVVVIGKAGRYIGKDRALDHVAGYSIFNDGSIRDYQFKSTQWMMGKNFDATGAFGPEFVTADERHDLRRAHARRRMLGSDDAAARRHHHQRHAGGRWLRAQAAALDEGRRRLRGRRRRHWRIAQQRRRRAALKSRTTRGRSSRWPP